MAYMHAQQVLAAMALQHWLYRTGLPLQRATAHCEIVQDFSARFGRTLGVFPNLMVLQQTRAGLMSPAPWTMQAGCWCLCQACPVCTKLCSRQASTVCSSSAGRPEVLLDSSNASGNKVPCSPPAACTGSPLAGRPRAQRTMQGLPWS